MKIMFFLRSISIYFLLGWVSFVMADDFLILKSPKYVHFCPEAGSVGLHEIIPVIAASFGLPLEDKNVEWSGLKETNLFRKPKANFLITLSGVHDNLTSLSYELKFDVKQEEDMDALNVDDIVDRLENVMWRNDPLIVKFAASGDVLDLWSHYEDVFADLPRSVSTLHDEVINGLARHWFTQDELSSLNMTRAAEFFFASQLYMMQEVVNILNRYETAVKTSSPDFFHFSITGLGQISKAYGEDSEQLKDAFRLAGNAIEHVIEGLRHLYGNDVMIELVVLGSEHIKWISRKSRSLLLQDDSVKENMNLAPNYSKDYSAVFQIIFWSALGFALAIWFVAYGIWFTDPGRDSIIYRMTSSRMKRD